MKKLLFILLSMTALVSAQNAKESEQSNAEKFSAKSGTLMQKEFIEVGNLKK